MEHLKKLGEQITKRRELLSLTQKDVATAVNLSNTTIQFIERGRPGVSIANWIKVADLLGLEIQVLNKKMSAEK